MSDLTFKPCGANGANVEVDEFLAALGVSPGGGGGSTSASDLTSGTLDPARIANESLPIAKTTGLAAALLTKATKAHLSIRDYGALADGSSDDTAAISACVAAAKAANLAIYVPKGVYRISSPIVLDWEGATIFGNSAQTGGSEIRVTANGSDGIYIPGPYDGITISKLAIHGNGRALSTANGINVRGDLVDGVGVDRSEISQVIITGFNVGLNLNTWDNSNVRACGLQENGTGLWLQGNSNSNVFQDMSITTGGPGGSGVVDIGARMSQGHGNSLIGIDIGGLTMLTAILIDGSTCTNIIGGQHEIKGPTSIDIQSAGTRRVNISGVHVRDFGVAGADRYSVRTNGDYVVISNCTLDVRSSTTGAAIRSSNASNDSTVYGPGSEKIDLYDGAGFSMTATVASTIPTRSVASGAVANAENWGQLWRRIYTSAGADVLNYSCKNAAGAYSFANLLKYHFDTQTNGTPAFIGKTNVFQQTQNLTVAANPYFSIGTATETSTNTFKLGVATTNDTAAFGTLIGDSLIVGATGGGIVLATSASGARTVRVKIKPSGVLHLVPATTPTYADNSAAGVGGLVAGDVYRTATGELRITY